MQICGLRIAPRSLYRSTKTRKFAAVAADSRDGRNYINRTIQARSCVWSSAKVRIAKFLDNSYQGYELGSKLNTAPGMLITPSS